MASGERSENALTLSSRQRALSSTASMSTTSGTGKSSLLPSSRHLLLGKARVVVAVLYKYNQGSRGDTVMDLGSRLRADTKVLHRPDKNQSMQCTGSSFPLSEPLQGGAYHITGK